MLKWFFACISIFTACAAFSQKQTYKTAIIGFYNLENFYDTINNTLVDDEEFLPNSARNYNTAVYRHKVNNLAIVLSQMGTDVNPDGPAILGVAEIENDTVLSDLVKHPLLKERNYQVIHYDSKDLRGVDVALLYNPKYFVPLSSKKIFVVLPDGAKESYFTRDVLYVKGKLDGEEIHVMVNHWPSRRGGEERSEPGRLAAASINRNVVDSVLKLNMNAKLVVMGDLNDDPLNRSITGVLKAKGKPADVKEDDMFNPWTDLYKKGIGTLAYNDAWGLFDQVIISHAWLSKQQQGFFYYRQQIFCKEFMKENAGRYKGYPMRTWDGMLYRGGYSDHFPTFVVMLKRVPS
ncbi:endonuclease/exonuclease/phosphatase family protein [Foetidibacter luteolus]|uniref:endonuclease/exonuclease/phosphatase family protein n=1 Tax=Foetidibacter luteolus TaxID=2608880 RepID=UPI00129B58B7|nr:endonuclease/exonuclease/phosphatase [Foetidibacter luteolus]